MKPRIICHMLASVDGRIDGEALEAVTQDGEYEATAAQLGGDAWLCGRTTMEHFAEGEPFVSASDAPAGPQPAFVARRAACYAIAVDTRGKLRWAKGSLGDDHLICVLSEQVPADYLDLLRAKGASYVVCGESSVDLARAVDLLGRHFGIRTLLLEGGGHINGAFLEAGLVDELSLLLVPGIDGRREVPAVFDGVDPSRTRAVALTLRSVERRAQGALWLRYQVVRA